MHYDLRPYLYFATVAEELSFTAAAARLNVAQPWLSTAMRQLEARMGFALFERTTRKVVLTPEGARLLPVAVAAIAAFNQVEAAAQEIRGAQQDILLGMLPFGIDMPVVEAVINRFTHESPQFRMQLEVGLSSTLTARLKAGKLHAAFTLGTRDIGDLQQVRLAEFESVIGFAPDDPLAERRQVDPDDLRGRTVVSFPRSSDEVLFDQVYAPFLAAGALIEENAQVWSQTFQPSPGHLIVTLNVKAIGFVDPLVRRRLPWAPLTPFQLVGAPKGPPAAIGALWAIARELGGARASREALLDPTRVARTAGRSID